MACYNLQYDLKNNVRELSLLSHDKDKNDFHNCHVSKSSKLKQLAIIAAIFHTLRKIETSFDLNLFREHLEQKFV